MKQERCIAVSKAGWLGAALLLALVLGLGYTAWRVTRSSEEHVCQACNRPIHPESRTVGLVGDRREHFCCPACAMALQYQTGKAVRIVELTDYETRSKLLRSQAYMARGSDVNPCMRQHMLLAEDKQPAAMQFDRCTPSLLAFASRESAERMVKAHGGQVVRFSDLPAPSAR